ncbi:phospholipase D-like domain-containing protein [Maritimibacter fusiformis]|uniref:Phospholipase D n=1 Tax=Maritimibacter fusiformis TaxID=2603819 RepID=A0A5D0RJF0_9RHOB|nr:phospholipase D-like domain-containing protein [Maritimibacter fusiformis]TYB81239.1 cardiolipin synthetase [Maritimibacter fusiformis]
MSVYLTQLAILIGILVAGTAVIWVLQQRRSPQSALAWILFILTVPYLGVPLFFTLGVRKWAAGYSPMHYQPAGNVPVLHPLDDKLRRLGVPPATDENRMIFEFIPSEAHDALCALIEGAEERIDVILYRLETDAEARHFLAQLATAARRGVRVRLILDGIGTWRRPRKALNVLKKAGAEVHIFAPLIQRLATVRMNLRNHRKMLIADGRVVWAGGRNVGNVYQGPPGKFQRWQDVSFTLRGPVVQRFCEVYEADWEKVTHSRERWPQAVPPEEDGTALVQLVGSGPDHEHDALHDALVHAVHLAENRIWIATPYFLPTDDLNHALALAARLGRDVRILVPVKSNQPLADFARGAYLRELHEAGCRILRYQDGMMHGKAMLIDDIAWTGSANVDVRSMFLNFEIALMVYDPEHVAALARWFAGLEADCVPGIKRARLPRRLAEATFRLGAPIL